MGGVQESPVHVKLDGPATTKPLGQVSSMESPILYSLCSGVMVRTSCTIGLRQSVPAGKGTFQMCLTRQNPIQMQVYVMQLKRCI